MDFERFGLGNLITASLSLLTIAGMLFGVPVWGYSQFVTIRERDSMRAVTLERLSTQENNLKEQTQHITELTGQVSELKGKIDTLILISQSKMK